MITFLWMLYLALTLLVTIKTIYWITIDFITHKTTRFDLIFGMMLTSLLWSIWYFYYLH